MSDDFVYIKEFNVWWPKNLVPKFTVGQVVMLRSSINSNDHLAVITGFSAKIDTDELTFKEGHKIDLKSCKFYYDLYLSETGETFKATEDDLYPTGQIGELLYV